MKLCVLTVALLMTLCLCSCSSTISSNAPTGNSNSSVDTNSASANSNTDAAPPAVDPQAKIENGQAHTFEEFTFVLPSHWKKIVSSESTFLCRAPTVEPRFGNCIITKDFAVNEYTNLDAEAAVTSLKSKKEAAGGGGRVQLLTIDNVTGVLEEMEFKDSTKPEAAEGVWKWETFMRSKEKRYLVRIGFTYPINDKAQSKPLIDGVINSVKIRRSPDLKVAESKPQ